jgi:beta-exotoxin I transport system ATP-binding protein
MSGVPVVDADRLTKFYGPTRGIEDLSFRLEPGEVFGYLGPNGAGKSTTIRTMLDLIRPTRGRIRVFGLDPRVDSAAVHARIGYVPGEFGLYERLTGAEYLRTFAAFRGGVDEARIRGLAERLSIDLGRRIRELSHGNKQKLGLIQAFMHEPELLVLDEPTQGLDPLVQQTFFALIDEARARGATVFLSSHVLPEVERVCDRVAIIREGRLVTISDIGELKASALRRIEIHFDRPVDPASFASLASVVGVEAQGNALLLSIHGPVDEVIKEAARHTVVSIASHEPSLEEIFLHIYRDGDG